MSMNVGAADGDGEEQFNNTINTTPLVDVMLVLLIIFLITIPVVTHTVQLSLPKEVNIAVATKLNDLEVGFLRRVHAEPDIAGRDVVPGHRQAGGRGVHG